MKKIILLFFIFLFYIHPSFAYDRGHVYITGKVDQFYSENIVISGREYKIAPECKVFVQYRENDAIIEKPGKLTDIRQGDWVTVKKIGTTLYEIMIERWKQ